MHPGNGRTLDSLSWRERSVHVMVRGLVACLFYGSRFFRRIRGRRQPRNEGIHVLLTGTFHSEAWIMAFLRPIAAATSVGKVTIVTTLPIDPDDKIDVVMPPAILRRIVGAVPARLITFLLHGFFCRPDIVGGFHISINGLLAELVASISGAKSLYVCVGGPIEIQDGGLWGESRLFGKLKAPDSRVEDFLVRYVQHIDSIVSMGTKAQQWFIKNKVMPDRIKVITGSIDASKIPTEAGERPVDLVFVGRLVPIKNLELLIQVVRELVREGIPVRARIVGQGPLQEHLERMTRECKLESNIEFAGFVPDVVAELIQAKCFVLTSTSEGVSLAMIEAMLAGTVPVVADVGDLGDLITNGETGYLVSSREPRDYADRIKSVLLDEEHFASCSSAARKAARRFDTSEVAQLWDTVFRSDVLEHIKTVEMGG